MQTIENGIKANNSSLVQKLKTFFKGKPVTAPPVYTHPTYLNRNKCVTINVNELSPRAKHSFNTLFTELFPQPLNQ